MKANIGKALISIIAMAFFVGCATSAPLKFDDTSETLLVYPLFDGRENKSENIEDLAGKNLKAHPVDSYYMGRDFNCIVSYASDLEIIPNASYADFKNDNTEHLKALRTNGENYVLAIFLNELGQAVITSFASMEAFLVRVETGHVIWTNAGKKTIRQGLFDRALGGYPHLAYSRALQETLKGFPVLRKTN